MTAMSGWRLGCARCASQPVAKSRRQGWGTRMVVWHAMRRTFSRALTGRLLFLSVCLAACAQQTTRLPRTGSDVRVPYSLLKPVARFKVGENADWVAVERGSVWVTSKGPNTLVRIDPQTNTVTDTIALPGDACSGFAFGFGSVWVPLCAKPNVLLRVDLATHHATALSPGAAGAEGGIAASRDSIWLVSDDAGTLNRIDPKTNSVRQRVALAPGSYNPVFDHGRIWVTSVQGNLVTAVNARTGAIEGTMAVGPGPRFLTAGGGSVWTLNQGDGTITRVDEATLQTVATIDAKIPGHGGDIAFGYGQVWATLSGTPLTRIDGRTNRVVRQWTGPGGDALRVGLGSIWITDYDKGLLLRIPMEQVREK